MKSIPERKSILDAAIRRFSRRGFVLIERTDTVCFLTKYDGPDALAHDSELRLEVDECGELRATVIGV